MTAPAFDAVYLKTNQGLHEALGKTRLIVSHTDRIVFSKIDGKNSINDIATMLAMEPKDVSKVIATFENLELVKHSTLYNSNPSSGLFERNISSSFFSKPLTIGTDKSTVDPAAYAISQNAPETALHLDFDQPSPEAASAPSKSHSPFDPRLSNSTTPINEFEMTNAQPLFDRLDASLCVPYLSDTPLFVLTPRAVRSIPTESLPPPLTPEQLQSTRLSAQERSEQLSIGRFSDRTFKSSALDSQRRFLHDVWIFIQEQAKVWAAQKSLQQQEELSRMAAALEEAQRSEAAERLQREALERQLEEERQRAESDRLAREQAELEAKIRAQEEERLRIERIERERQEREVREQQEALERARLRRLGIRKQRLRIASAAGAVAFVIVFALSIIFRASVSPEDCSKIASDFFNTKSTVSECSFALSPAPSITMKGINSSNGNLQVDSAKIHLSFLAFLFWQQHVDHISIQGAKVLSDALLTLSNAQKASSGKNATLSGENISIYFSSVVLGPMNVAGRLGPQGELQSLKFSNDIYSLESTFNRGMSSFSFTQLKSMGLTHSQFGPIEDLSLNGFILPDGLRIDDLSIRHASGFVRLTDVLVSWSGNQWTTKGTYSTLGTELSIALPWLFTEGRASLDGVFSAKGSNPIDMFESVSFRGTGALRQTSVKLDIGRIIGIGQSMAGATRISDTTISYELSPSGQSVDIAQAQSGPVKFNLNIQKNGSTFSGAAQAQYIQANESKSANFDIQSRGTGFGLIPK